MGYPGNIPKIIWYIDLFTFFVTWDQKYRFFTRHRLRGHSLTQIRKKCVFSQKIGEKTSFFFSGKVHEPRSQFFLRHSIFSKGNHVRLVFFCRVSVGFVFFFVKVYVHLLTYLKRFFMVSESKKPSVFTH